MAEPNALFTPLCQLGKFSFLRLANTVKYYPQFHELRGLQVHLPSWTGSEISPWLQAPTHSGEILYKPHFAALLNISSALICLLVSHSKDNFNITHFNPTKPQKATFKMHFTKITIFSIVALATALPNAAPEPDANQLEARTFSWNWKNKNCHCKCDEGRHDWKRDEGNLETRTLSWWYPSPHKDHCPKQCKKKCDKVSEIAMLACSFSYPSYV